MAHRHSADDLVVKVKDELAVLFRGGQFKQIDEVGAVKLAGLTRQARRQISVTNNRHTVIGDIGLTGASQLAVATP